MSGMFVSVLETLQINLEKATRCPPFTTFFCRHKLTKVEMEEGESLVRSKVKLK